MKPLPKDRAGNDIQLGAYIRLLGISGNWFEELSPHEKVDVSSMIGEVFEIEEIDEHGHPWISKSWPNKVEGEYHSHSIALESQEMELVTEHSL